MMEKSFSDEMNFEAVKENYLEITENISNAMKKSGRTDKVRLMAVTKTVPPAKINYAVSLGATLLGENRVQEFLGKIDEYDKNSEIHFIGGLQNNKVKYIIDKVAMIHSVNSLKLAEEISKRAVGAGRIMDILLEVNIGLEESKSGVMPKDLPYLIDEAVKLDGIRLRGLMAIPPVDVDGSNRKYFAEMEKLFSEYKEQLNDSSNVMFDTLSMGMSKDYAEAVEFGSTIVRIGSSLFGYRK